MSLIEVMVGLAIAGVLLAAMTTMLTLISTELSSSNAKFNVTGLAQQTRNLLTSTKSCTAILAGVQIDPTKPSSVKFTLPPALAVGANVTPPGERYYIRDIYFDTAQTAGVSANGKPVVNANLVLDTATLDGTRRMNDPGYKGRQFASVLVGNFSLEVNAAGGPTQIVSCQAAVNSDFICKDLGGIIDETGKCQMTPRYDLVCAKFGGTWDGTTCHPSGQLACASLGGTWSGSACSLGGGTVTVVGGGGGNCGDAPNGSSKQEGPPGGAIGVVCNYLCAGGTWVNQGCFSTLLPTGELGG